MNFEANLQPNRFYAPFVAFTAPLLMLAALLPAPAMAEQITPAINYQGELSVQGRPASGPFDFEFRVYDVDSGGSEIANTVILDDVTVTDGVFSVDLDFGLTPYAGDQLWIEVSVREGGDSGGYQALLPRQKINPAPYALHAEMVAIDAIAGAEIADSSITAADLADSSVSGSEVLDGSLTASDLAVGAVNGSSILDNSVGAEDLATGAVGSDEIADGSVLATDLAADSVGAEQVAAGAIGSDEIKPSEIQTRVTGTCEPGTYLVGINEDGSASCQQLPVGIGDTIRTVAFFSSVGIRSDGRPLVAVVGDGGLFVYDCTNLVCSTGTLRQLGTTGGQTFFPNLAIRSNGLPIVSYRQGGNLKIYDCTELDCTTGVERILDGSANTGNFSDMVLRADGLPFISYYDGNAGDLKVFDCADSSCATGITRTLDSVSDVGAWTSIAIRSDGAPIISYIDRFSNNLLVYRCANVNCTAGSRRTLDGTGSVGDTTTSIAVRPGRLRQDGFPIVSYRDQDNDRLKVYRCDDENCDTGSVRIVDDAGLYSNIAIRFNGLPVISHFDPTNGEVLKVVDCLDVDCQSGLSRTLAAADFTITMGLAIRPNGLPFLSYAGKFGFLNVFSCGDDSCQN